MNTEAIKNCPRCKAPIPAEAPEGLCPNCVLAAASIATEQWQSTEAGPPPSLETIAAGFPQLEILEFIGQGGMGLVFKARQPKLDRFVALKLLPQKPGADPAFCERFHREARVLARLSHPNIVAVHDFGEAGPFFYLLMEYVDGVNLRQAMRAGRFTPAQALALVPKICDALQYAHEEGVLHRDIKPENLLLDTRGRVKIADFGIAKLLRDTKDITLTASAIGTPHYMAPEQLEHPKDVDQRADVYSLGVVFYEMLTGELPLGRFAPPSEKTPMDPRVDQVVLRALEKERERRFQSAGDVKTHVEQITRSPAASQAGPTGTVNLTAAGAQLETQVDAAKAAISARSLLAWPIRVIGVAALTGVTLLAFGLFLHIRGGPPAVLLGALVLLALLAFDVFLLRRLLRGWASQLGLPHSELAAILSRIPRRSLWLLGSASTVLVLLVLLISQRHMRRLEEPTTTPAAEVPNAPAGFEVAPGGVPGNDRLYRSSVMVPSGYALTLATVLCSNQVVVKSGPANGTAVLMAPQGQPVQGVLTWRLLGNTSFADGAPLQLSLALAGPEAGDKSFNIVPPEAVTIDWASEPLHLWPPQNGHTKFLLIKGLSANPSPQGEPPTEWAVGLEARLDPIPENVLRELRSPVVKLGTNGFAMTEEHSAQAASQAAEE
jgi:tRNA A-37 threonylcarbamoyl transferase component Bud32